MSIISELFDKIVGLCNLTETNYGAIAKLVSDIQTAQVLLAKPFTPMDIATLTRVTENLKFVLHEIGEIETEIYGIQGAFKREGLNYLELLQGLSIQKTKTQQTINLVQSLLKPTEKAIDS